MASDTLEEKKTKFYNLKDPQRKILNKDWTKFSK